MWMTMLGLALLPSACLTARRYGTPPLGTGVVVLLLLLLLGLVCSSPSTLQSLAEIWEYHSPVC